MENLYVVHTLVLTYICIIYRNRGIVRGEKDPEEALAPLNFGILKGEQKYLDNLEVLHPPYLDLK